MDLPTQEISQPQETCCQGLPVYAIQLEIIPVAVGKILDTEKNKESAWARRKEREKRQSIKAIYIERDRQTVREWERNREKETVRETNREKRFLVLLLWLLKVDTSTWVQIMDETLCILHNLKTPGKDKYYLSS